MVLLFGGTSEGRRLAERLAEKGIPVTVCVATEYGGALLPTGACAQVGRLDADEMMALMQDMGPTCVVDATHPYAQKVTQSIQRAATTLALPYYRLVRDGDVEGDWLTAPNMAGAAALCQTLPGKILLTTGSKELDAFAKAGLCQRCCPRVLPSVDSLTRCLTLGFPAGQVICMQGPCVEALNRATVEQYKIKIVVTKASGGAGGFWEKVAAARETGCTLIVVDRPVRETGYSLAALDTLLGKE